MSKKIKGKLRVRDSGLFQAILPTKKGDTAPHNIPKKAIQFRKSDAEDGCDIVVVRERGAIKKVTIPGTEGVESGPAVFGLAFHNPYTFVPFPDREPGRKAPSGLTADEPEGGRDRRSGILELEVTTKSPLITSEAEPDVEENEHKTYRALTIGDDVVLPATGVRGFLRTLITILTGGPLTHLDRDLFLCADRDLNLGPRSKNNPDPPKKAFLGRVVTPGSPDRPGVIELGETVLVPAKALKKLRKGPLPRPRPHEKVEYLWADHEGGKLTRVEDEPSRATPWQVKLSGRPINPKGKREGLFLGSGQQVTLPPSIWAQYLGRHKHGDHPELDKGDLVWLEPTDYEAEAIESAEDIRSIQWARLGRRGKRMGELVPEHLHPDNCRDDRTVSEVTDLFGQVPTDRDSDAPAFAGRIRPENLVFRDAKPDLDGPIPLAVMGQPHPANIAFYRDNEDPESIGKNDSLKGYKVYRTTNERGADAPWHYAAQPVFETAARPKEEQQKINQSCQLLPEGRTGTLRIAFRALSPRELALLLRACHLPWRLGGGKPLGLGLCEVRVRRLLDETGAETSIPADWKERVGDIEERADLWQASQTPVDRVRYPRAADANRNRVQRGGHVWFPTFAAPSKSKPGLQPVYLKGELKEKAGRDQVPGQILKPLDPDDPDADLLYAYDGFTPPEDIEEKGDRRKFRGSIKEFDPETDALGPHRSGGSQSQTRESRQEGKRRRRRRK